MLMRALVAATAIAVAGLMCQPVSAQSHFEKRMVTIKQEVGNIPSTTTGTVVMLGDSITEQFFSSGEMPKDLGGMPVVNEGIGGDTIGTSTSKEGVFSRLEQVKQAKPAVVFLMIGINNMWDKNQTAEAVIGMYEDLVPQLKAAVPNAKVVLQTVLPTRGDKSYTNSIVVKLNERIKQLAKEHGLEMLDTYSELKDDRGELRAEYSSDGVHLTSAAYKVWLGKLQDLTAKLKPAKVLNI